MKKILVLVFGIVVFLLASSPTIGAAENVLDLPNLPELPEVSGLYKDPKNTDIIVKVFVHNLKNKTQGSMSSTCYDPDSTAIIGWAGWKLPNTTWKYSLNPLSAPFSVGITNLPTIANNSFSEWNKAFTTTTKPTLVRGLDTLKTKSVYDKQNIITWGKASNGTLAITYIRYNTVSKEVVDVDTIINSRYPWSWSTTTCGNQNSYDAQAILTHELGHWYGLDDEYTAEYTNNTMYGYGYKNDIKADTLTTGDILGIRAIYP